jgi:cytochrome b pre-mRNA-processing protein 3
VRLLPARLALAVLPIALMIVWMWLAGGQRRAIEELPPAERLAAYRSSLAAFEALCAQPSAGLEATCTERARLLIYFPECDTRCRQLTLPQLRPHRS